MTKNVVIGVVAAMTVGSLVARGAITGSKHDFSSWAGGQICLPCHAPHNNQNSTGSLLWNHNPSLTAASGYTFYSSLSMKAATPTAMSEISRTCMSCHDGTTAIDAYGGKSGSLSISSTNNLGTNLGNDHPISITYDAALGTSTNHLFNPTTKASGIAGSAGTIDTDMLAGHKIECSSCHDVHNSYSITYMLKKSNANSGLCLTCHDK